MCKTGPPSMHEERKGFEDKRCKLAGLIRLRIVGTLRGDGQKQPHMHRKWRVTAKLCKWRIG